MTIDQISVFVENKPGKLVEIIEALSGAGIDLRAMSIADTANFGILRLIVNKPVKAKKILTDAGCVVKMNEVIPVSVDDEPGGLAKVLRTLADAGFGVEYAYAFVAHERGHAYVVIRVEETAAAVKVLEENGVKLISAEEMYGM